MHLGFGLYRHQLDRAHLDFARQCGATHIVLHMVDYFRSARANPANDQPVGDDRGWGLAGDPEDFLEPLAVIARQGQTEIVELLAVTVQFQQQGIAIGEADVAPHFGMAGGDTGEIAESGSGEGEE